MQNIDKLISANPTLAKLSKNLSKQRQLLDLIQTLLPDSVASHCVATIQFANSLTLFTDSPVWANRIRYLTPQLIEQLKSQLPQVEKIKVRILPASNAPTAESEKRHPTPISDSGAEHLRTVASYIEDPDLSAALFRLAQHSSQKR